MNFDLNDEQQAIKETAREFLSARFKPAKVRELAEARSYDEDLTKQIAELGWPGIAIAEEHGGQDLGMVELAVLSEEIGFHSAPAPFLGTVGAALAIEEAGSDEQKAEWLPKLASGEATGAFGGVGPDRESTLFTDLPYADVVVTFDGQGGALLAPADEVDSEVAETIDATRQFGRVSGAAGEALPGDPEGARDRIAVAIAAELTGIGQRAMEMAVDYAREREQFGRPIGAYQAVSHRCAAMLLAVEESRSLTYYAAWTADAEPESLQETAAMAGARAADAAWQTANDSLQVHGGIGFTWEHDLQFWLKRSKVTGELLCTPRGHRDRVAELALREGVAATAPA